MKMYDYREAVKADIREWVSENCMLDALRPQLAYDWEGTLDKLESQMRSAITGNDCGSYTCNAWQAEEFLNHNLVLLEEASRDFDIHRIYRIRRAATCLLESTCSISFSPR